MSKLVRDESGIAMGLAVILILIIGVMGAGLLVFVRNDLEAVVEVNQGQRAFEMADAGVQAAARQLEADSDSESYNGDSDDVQWSASKPNSSCSSLGDSGICLTDLYGSSVDDKVNVQIEYRNGDNDFRVVSTGGYRDSKRSVEAILEPAGGVDIPPVIFTRKNLKYTGSAGAGVSAFALGDVEASGGSSSGDAEGEVFGKWAETSGPGPYPNASGSFPNDFNETPRESSEVGLAAQGELKLSGNAAANFEPGIRSFGNTYEGKAEDECPGSSCPRVVPDYDASELDESDKIAFPFDVPSAGEDTAMIDTLRERALELERENPGESYYFDSDPGNGDRDSGRTDKYKFELDDNDWPSGSDWDTVVFFDFEEPKKVEWKIKDDDVSCSNTDRKGIMVINNGNFEVSSSGSGFNGGIITRGQSATDPDEGEFKASGSSCLNAYVNASGEIEATGSSDLSNVPPPSTLSSLQSGVESRSWRECYTIDCE